MNNKYWLRLLRDDDLEFLLKTETDPQNQEFTTLEEHPDEEMLKEFLLSDHDLEKYGQLRQVIDSEIGPVGFIDLYDADGKFLIAGVGIYVDRNFRKKGAALSALKLLAAQMKNWGYKSLYADVAVNNPGSHSLFEKAGYASIRGENGMTKFVLTL